MAKRLLRYSSSSFSRLNLNVLHKTAAQHALEIYCEDAVCSFIPKNACSTLRYSVALNNGLINDEADFDWIHQNNLTFNPTLRSLSKAKYTFTVLRCPFRRLASVFIDKIISLDYHTMNTFFRFNGRSSFYRLMKNRVRKRVGLEPKSVFGISTPSSFTFSDFVELLSSRDNLYANEHWAPQVSMLVYMDYDDWFRVENLSHASNILKNKINFDLIDTRDFSGHSTISFSQEDVNASTLTVSELAAMKLTGSIPSYRSLYCSDTVAAVSRLFREDIMLYCSKFGKDELLFAF